MKGGVVEIRARGIEFLHSIIARLKHKDALLKRELLPPIVCTAE